VQASCRLLAAALAVYMSDVVSTSTAAVDTTRATRFGTQAGLIYNANGTEGKLAQRCRLEDPAWFAAFMPGRGVLKHAADLANVRAARATSTVATSLSALFTDAATATAVTTLSDEMALTQSAAAARLRAKDQGLRMQVKPLRRRVMWGEVTVGALIQALAFALLRMTFGPAIHAL
jgi:hypothetical protein